MSKLLENGLEAQVLNGLTRDNTKVTVLNSSTIQSYSHPPRHEIHPIFIFASYHYDLGSTNHIKRAGSREEKSSELEPNDQPILTGL